MTAEATTELLRDLTEAQRQAVLHTDGPLLILAGPGSGKTRVVTRRAAHLAATVASPHQILAITFTNKAAKEMQQRIAALGVAPGMTVGTFHALCAKLLRIHHQRAGVPRNFTIFDRDDRRKLLKQAIEECGLSTTNFAPAAVESVISKAKNELLSADGYAAGNLDWRERGIARIFTAYERLLAGMAALDFDDLLLRMANLLSRDDELRGELGQRYRYLLIDEYQDINAPQYTIARMLAQAHDNICATGDPDQSIYGWRGADIENILRFERDYPNAVVVRLEQNYRSTRRILAAADALITGNLRRKAKRLWTENDEGAAVRVCEYESGEEEAAMIARDIARRLRSGIQPDTVAIFYRVNSLSRVIEEACLREGIHYQIARGLEFYSRREIKDVLAYLRVLVNPADEVSLRRIINTPPRGIGDTTVDRLVELARQSQRSVHDVLTGQNDLAALGRSATKVRQFGDLLLALKPVTEWFAPQALESVMSRTGLRAMYYEEGADASEGPSANLDELVSAASTFQQDHTQATLVDWLEFASLIGDVDTVQDSGPRVTLLTLHAAKGLEFDTVYMVALEDGILPYRRHGDDEVNGDVEEERRLCFVGMTRARRHLTLSRARYRMMRGVTQRTVRSTFLDELPRELVECEEQPRPTARSPARPVDYGRLPDDVEEWSIGTLVRHPQYGVGQILSMHRGARRTHVDVLFRDGTRHSWVLEFAELQRVDYDDVG